MINYVALEKAIFDWASNLSGYASSQVIWKDQDGDAPTGDYLTLFLGDLRPLGFDAMTSTTDLAAPAGQEVTISASGDREFSVMIEAYTVATTGASARAILAAMLTKSSLPTPRAILDAVDVSHFDQGTISYLPTIKEVGFQGRGVWDCRMYVRDTASESATYIERAEIRDIVAGNVIIVDT